jgi:hypothetical protein
MDMISLLALIHVDGDHTSFKSVLYHLVINFFSQNKFIGGVGTCSSIINLFSSKMSLRGGVGTCGSFVTSPCWMYGSTKSLGQ